MIQLAMRSKTIMGSSIHTTILLAVMAKAVDMTSWLDSVQCGYVVKWIWSLIVVVCILHYSRQTVKRTVNRDKS